MDTKKHLAARTGFDLYIGSGRRMNRDSINRELDRRGLPPIAERTFGHYRRMTDRGQVAYMPINEFDMAVKAGLFSRAG